MRALLLVLILTLAPLAGCIDGVTPASLGEADDDQASTFSMEGHPEFCTSEENCKFWDDMYHQYVVYDLDTTVINVVILPPAGMTTPDLIETSRMAVQGWYDGIMAFGADWLTEAFEMNIVTVGVDVPTLADVEDPTIVVMSTSALGIFGIGLAPTQFGCMILGEETLRDLGGHYHSGGYVFAQDCTGSGFTCFAINVGGLAPNDLYDLIAHEVGHCLGPGHVGDALDFRARYAPVTDIMSYQLGKEHVNCVSNMNVRVIEGVYAHLLDRPEAEWLPRGSYLEFDPATYENFACENPPGMR